MKSIVLPPLSLLYGAVTRTRLSLYRRGTFHTTKLDRPVISIGNITTGGTGKTPLVEYVARLLAAQGKKVCILTRGYGRKDPHLQVIVSDGYGVLASPSEAGDEPYLLATKLKGLAAVISSADRIAAGQEAIKDFGTDCFVLDDGFQHLRLARDLNVVTIDATNPWGGGRLLPHGRLRESTEGMSRADCVVITRCDQVKSVEGLRAELVRLTDGKPIFESQMRMERLSPLKNGGETLAPEARVAAFCAVGNPASFFESLRRAGYELAVERSFADHHVYSQEEIDSIINAARETDAKALVTTAKDAVKLRALAFSMPCYVLEIDIAIEGAAEFTQLVLGAAP
ncbi:MAG TPA: tetraacyldisaccharide 4'-kinase [Pyrinomonadaceae bacterium]|jgi:tetraacyldisaccharide 4'-kinase|nr:tetraacyldisaccharide 4'-kinase [Pyrinomonadaceae bacterium]